MRKRCAADDWLNRRKHRSRKLQPNHVASRVGYSDELDRSDKIWRKLEHLVYKLGHLRKWIQELKVKISDVIELITCDQFILATGIGIVREGKTQPAAIACVDQKLKRVSLDSRRNGRFTQFVVAAVHRELQLSLDRARTGQLRVTAFQRRNGAGSHDFKWKKIAERYDGQCGRTEAGIENIRRIKIAIHADEW